MTRAEYLEFVQEALCFPPDMSDHVMHMDAKPGLYPCHPDYALRDTPAVCGQLQEAHRMYCKLVERILFPERPEDNTTAAMRVLMDSTLINSVPRMVQPTCYCGGSCDGGCLV